MLDAIRFAANAVAKKDTVGLLTHFRIKGGRITGSNGRIALSSDLGVDLDVMPHAASFLAAVKASGDETIALNVTPSGKLAVRAGSFRAYVNCPAPDAGAPPFPEPSGEIVDLGPSFLDGVKLIAPVMSVDSKREWAHGIKLQSDSMFATNNVMIVEFWHGTKLPFDAVIPAAAINELIRVNEAPTKVQVSENTITFWFGPKRYLLSVVLESSQWPMIKIADVLNRKGEYTEIQKEFADAIATLKPFIDRETVRTFIDAKGIRTSLTDGEGASVDLEFPSITKPQAYSYEQLRILTKVASSIDWSFDGPKPFILKDHYLRGVMLDIRI